MSFELDNVDLTCPQCHKTAQVLYRDKPLGEIARFVCLRCLPCEMMPDSEAARVGNALWKQK